MPPTRIAFVITDLHLGGSPRMLRDLAVGLKQHPDGFQPIVISLKPLPTSATTANPAMVVDDLRNASIPVHSLELRSLAQLPAGALRLKRLLQDPRPQVVLSILIHANVLASVTMPLLRDGPRPKFVQSMHTLQSRPAWHWTAAGIIAPLASAIVAPSQAILDRIATYGHFKRGVVIPNGIDVERFARAQAIEEVPWPQSARVVGYVGRFDPVKNLPLLLKAFALLPGDDMHLALVGYGPEESPLRSLAESLKISRRVHFTGPTTTPERWYKTFACHCLPSTAEGFGLTLVESIAAGVPVVAIKTAVTAEIVRDKIDGLLVDNPTATALATAIEAVLSSNYQLPITNYPPIHPISPPFAPNSGPEYVQNRFSTTRMVELYAKFFKNF